MHICPVKAPYLGNVQYRNTCLYLFPFSPVTQKAIHDEVESSQDIFDLGLYTL